MILIQYEQLSLIIFDVNFNLIENKYFICIRTIECKYSPVRFRNYLWNILQFLIYI